MYICLAEDIINLHSKNDISTDKTIQLYYPFLYNKNINDIDTFNDSKDSLIKDSSTIIESKDFTKNISNISMLYDIFNKKTSDIPYNINGITNIQLTIYQRISYKIPLDIIFKLVQTSQVIPLIKFNPGNRKEKLYRLYTKNIAINGNNIPYLSKAKIFKLQKYIARPKSIAYYINPEDGIDIIATLKDNGSISIEIANVKSPLTITLIEKYIFSFVNPILNTIKEFIEQSGFTFPLFKDINETNVEINDMSYFINVPISKNISVSKYIGCLSNVFNVEKDDISKEILLRFKRVSNFNEMDSQEAFIVVQYGLKKGYQEIITLLQQNFSLSKENAEKKIASFLNDAQVEMDMNESKKMKIKSNPGFEVLINKEQFTNNINIYVNNINNLNYLKTIPIYIDTLLRMSQDDYTTDVDNETINNNCLTNSDTFVDDKKDIIPEKTITQLITPIVQGNQKKMVDFLFSDDEEDEGEDDEGEDDEGEDDEDDEGKDDEDDEGEDDEDDDEESEVGEPKDKDDDELKNEKNNEYVNQLKKSIQKTESNIEDTFNESKVIGNIIDSESMKDEPMVQLYTKADDADEIEMPLDEPTPFNDDIEFGEELQLSDDEEDQEQEDDIEFGEELQLSDDEEDQEDVEFGEEIELSDEDEKEQQDEEEEQQEEEEEEQQGEQQQEDDEEGVNKDEGREEEVVFGDELELSDEDDDSDNELNISPIVDSPSPSPTPTPSPTYSTSTPRPQSGGAKNDDNEKDITGMSLSNPNPFSNRLIKRDPKLFLVKAQKGYNAYSRLCPSNYRRQPVILTDNEKENIDKNHPGSYTKALKYGSSKDKQNWYICPRYRCLKNNVPLSEKDVKDGKCGGKIIPFGAKEVPKGAYIYEFKAPGGSSTDKKGNYVPQYPGFTKKDSHPDGLCVPCCFKDWDSNKQKKRREECLNNNSEKKPS